MGVSLILAVLLVANPAPGTEKPLDPIYESRADLVPQGKIDELVFADLKRLGIPPAHLCSDGVFIRRVYLDAIGTLPTAAEARQFIRDEDPNKRRALVDRLLARPEFANYWALKWGDLLRVKAEFPINLWPNAVQAYHRWIYTCVKENMPYDRFVRELLTANGSNFRVGQVNFYRAVQSKQPAAIAQAVALTFMGTRAENWPAERLAGMGAFFAQISYKSTAEWKEEIVAYDPDMRPAKAAGGAAPAAIFPDGTAARLSPQRDPRAVFADWLTAPQNPWFARNIVNRVWSWLLGRGIVHEPDDMRPDNPPSNPALLAYLEKELVGAHYDLKHIYRLILNSETYQLSSIPRSKDPQGEAHFGNYPLRRLEAEVLIDALDEITGTTEKYSSAIPEPFTFIPEAQRSISLPDGSITSSFLEMFGRPPRDTGLEAERNNRATGAQRLHLLNSSHIQQKIEQGPKIAALMTSAKRGNGQVVKEVYLTILSRFPTDDELKVIAAHAGPGKGRDTVIDLVWVLVNSAEFLYRH
jgi:hypothetical protein